MNRVDVPVSGWLVDTSGTVRSGITPARPRSGGAYMDATATLHGLTSGVTATESQQIGLPLPGLDFRAFPLPGSHRLILDGNVEGMSFGGYGRFVKAGVNAGVFLARGFAVEAGYMLVDADLHSQSGARGVAPRFSGPVFSLRLER